jgi:hypothetical protein
MNPTEAATLRERCRVASEEYDACKAYARTKGYSREVSVAKAAKKHGLTFLQLQYYREYERIGKVRPSRTNKMNNQTEPATPDVQMSARDQIANILGGEVYVCGRTWTAWSYGTMDQDDFKLAGEDDDIMDAIDAVVQAEVKRKNAAMFEALERALEIIADLYKWEPIEAANEGCAQTRWSGPRHLMPEGLIEIGNAAGVPPDEMEAKLAPMRQMLTAVKTGSEVGS